MSNNSNDSPMIDSFFLIGRCPLRHLGDPVRALELGTRLPEAVRFQARVLAPGRRRHLRLGTRSRSSRRRLNTRCPIYLCTGVCPTEFNKTFEKM